jgi:hypothetical protein
MKSKLTELLLVGIPLLAGGIYFAFCFATLSFQSGLVYSPLFYLVIAASVGWIVACWYMLIFVLRKWKVKAAVLFIPIIGIICYCALVASEVALHYPRNVLVFLFLIAALIFSVFSLAESYNKKTQKGK